MAGSEEMCLKASLPSTEIIFGNAAQDALVDGIRASHGHPMGSTMTWMMAFFFLWVSLF